MLLRTVNSMGRPMRRFGFQQANATLLTNRKKWLVYFPYILIGASVILFLSNNFLKIVLPFLNHKSMVMQNTSMSYQQTFAKDRNLEISTVPYQTESRENNTYIDKDLFELMVTALHNLPFPGTDFYIQYEASRLGLQPLTNATPLMAEYGSVTFNNITSFHYLSSIKVCDYSGLFKLDNKNTTAPVDIRTPTLFVAILSAPEYVQKREIIRQTWLKLLLDSVSMRTVGYTFIVGRVTDNKTNQQVEEESKKFGDILLVDVIETGSNMSVKLAAMVNWLNQHCNQVDYVFKVNDDVYVNLRKLKQVVDGLNKTEKSIYGFAANEVPRRDRSKLAIKYEDWPWRTLPPHLVGASVLIPGVAIRGLLAAIQTVPYFRLEDPYILGLCTNKANISSRSLQNFYSETTKSSVPEPCYVNQYISWLTQSPAQMNNSHSATEDFYSNRTQCT